MREQYLTFLRHNKLVPRKGILVMKKEILVPGMGILVTNMVIFLFQTPHHCQTHKLVQDAASEPNLAKGGFF